MTSLPLAVAINVDVAPAVTMAWTYSAMTQSLAIVMNNAALAQQNSQTTANAASSVTCARILSALGTK